MANRSKSKTQYLKEFLAPKPKYRIIERNNKYNAQEFFGFWKIGRYLSITYPTSFPFSFDFNTLESAEEAINRAKESGVHITRIVAEYDK